MLNSVEDIAPHTVVLLYDLQLIPQLSNFLSTHYPVEFLKWNNPPFLELSIYHFQLYRDKNLVSWSANSIKPGQTVRIIAYAGWSCSILVTKANHFRFRQV